MLLRVLTMTLLAGALAVPTQAQAADPTPCTGVKVGPAQEVVSNATRRGLGLEGWADTAYGVLSAGGGKYDFLAVAALVPKEGKNQSIAVTKGTLDNPVSDGVSQLAPVVGLPAGYDYGGGGPVYRDAASGIILQMLHLEQSTPGGFYSTLHLGRFDPATKRTTYLGPLAAPRATKDQVAALRAAADMGTPAFTARDGYLYVHFPDYFIPAGGGYGSTALSVARAPLADVLSAAADKRVVPWHKYLDGRWDSPAVGGASSDVRPGERGAWHPNVVRTAGGGSLLVQGVSPNEFVLSNSSDGILSWSAAVPLFRDPDKFNAYPTVVGTGADPAVVGNEFYVYYLQWNTMNQDWTTAQMMRRLVSCTGGIEQGLTALVRSDNGSRHRVTTAPVTERGFYPTRTWMLESGSKPGTVPVYSCRSGAQDQFVSTNADCEGTSFLQTLGWIYAAPPSAPSVALYRCHVPGLDDHYLSTDTGCENSKAINESRVGYALSTTRVAFSRFFNGSERWVTSGAVTSAYAAQKRWFIEGTQQPGTAALYGCSYGIPNGTNHFISVDAGCEGQTRLRTEGWIHASPSGAATTPLYRCYLPSTYDHFLGGADCDGVGGARREGLMGYVVP
ncbi:hypothetical protein HPO96_33315 [Kribbella sandramycini]|uniref:LGFP repeat-containing protein n=1 Tax=Kribbella sandramycini TaxID=60450 RepID=A0A7Y4P4H7_9ACTN|nr:hypothetical protein [Kribbella sandramycini]MBB6566140.1 hypothetical protein [Kribbella sandramycini]NOL45140.1 hypothetical protein [Kribbella sandramycini]